MSIEQTDIVDFLSAEDHNVNNVILTISDHLGWEATHVHLLKLQEKLNTYLRFIESGEIFQTCPNAKGRNIVIQVIAKYPPNAEGSVFLEKVRITIEDAGFEFRHVIVDGNH